MEEAAAHYFAASHNNIEVVLAGQGKFQEAEVCFNGVLDSWVEDDKKDL
ncbi:MAG: hypothetical protein Q8K00_02850 [Syntrophales bacterium]|nr:hypothetical protein [Syntrophales bacterium]